MSLEKFQATDAWRNKLKNLLFIERKTPSVTTQVLTTPQRLSLQLSEDFQIILEEKNIPRAGEKMPRVRDTNDKENFQAFHERLHNNTPTKLKRKHVVDDTIVDEANDMHQITDTSFGTLEEMCEKTASDPDSTLFHYLRKGSPVQNTRAGAMLPTYDEEAEALQRLLDELNVEETEKRMKAIQTSPNVTQLDEVEEPSRFWENTISAETLQSISPVKMVGLMRQSTIMEEYSDVSESENSSTSYQSALKTGFSSETTGCYETANDTGACSEQGVTKKVSINSSGASSTSDLFQQRHSRQKFFSDDEKLEESHHLIDLDTTIKSPADEESGVQPIADSPASPEPAESYQRSSSDFQEEEEHTSDPLKLSPESTAFTEYDGSSAVIELSDDESSGCSKKNESEQVLNRSFTIKSETNKTNQEDDEEKSLHFNDTMEEVEYMMNKGMQYMQAAKKNSSSPAKTHLTAVQKCERYRSPSPMLTSPASPKTVIAKPKPTNKHVLNIKPFPKLDLFKKPQGSRPLGVQNRMVSSVKKQQFAHVVSPIGAYIKKTPTTPLVTTIKPGCSGSATSSNVFKQLHYESKVSPRKEQTLSKNQPCSLPKKAYISSEYKHVVDERTQFVIPGGPKVHRYLQSSMIPAVVRHEGKVKIPTHLRPSDMEPSPAPRRTDDSLADLSMISGDVSVYTIRDAQKF